MTFHFVVVEEARQSRSSVLSEMQREKQAVSYIFCSGRPLPSILCSALITTWVSMAAVTG